MSNDPQHNRDMDSGEWLKRSWDDWDAGVPSDTVWEEIEASVVSEKLWNRVNASLEAEEHIPDSWMVASHQAWEPSSSTDVWERLNESISLEQVWQGLDQSLNRRAVVRPSYWKLAVASVVALLVSTHFTDTPVRVTETSDAAFVSRMSTSTPLTVSPGESTTNTTSLPEVTNPYPVQVANNPDLQPQVPTRYDGLPQPIGSGNRTLLSAKYSLLSSGRKTPVAFVASAREDNSLPGLSFRTLDFPNSWNNLNASLAVHTGERPMAYNHWTAQVGAQLSILQERDQELLTSTLPRFGLAADMSYRHKVGPFQLIHSIGVSQYSQTSGKYVNGRHLITSQQVNAAQFHSTIGYTYKRFTLYGGLLVSKMLNGLEQNENTVTKVYDFGKAQAGLTAGLDVRLFTFPRSGNQLSFGSQYQWIPSSGGVKSSFENIHGLRFQTKFSF